MSDPISTPASKVQLTLFSLLRAHGAGADRHWSPLVGADQVRAEQGQLTVTAASVPFHLRSMDPRAPRAGQGLLALFGIRDALDELQHWRAVARNTEARFAYVQLQVEAGAVDPSVLTRAVLRAKGASLKFLNVRRCAAEMQKEWLQRFAGWVAAEGGEVGRDMSHVRQMALRPDLFERLLFSDPDLQAIDVMVLPLADRADPSRIRQVAYLRAGTPVKVLVQGGDQIHIVLPEWMGQRQSALAALP